MRLRYAAMALAGLVVSACGGSQKHAEAQAGATSEARSQPSPRIGATEAQPTNAVAPAEIMYSVLFLPNSAEVTPIAKPKLDEVVKSMRDFPRPAWAIVAGFTDASGDETDNARLSQQRADAVARYLESRGISAERISTQGFGSTTPASKELTPSQRAFDRRVDIVIR
jgi:outer membrane protein OmpA-like peptidoglycan-associated protein